MQLHVRPLLQMEIGSAFRFQLEINNTIDVVNKHIPSWMHEAAYSQMYAKAMECYPLIPVDQWAGFHQLVKQGRAA